MGLSLSVGLCSIRGLDCRLGPGVEFVLNCDVMLGLNVNVIVSVSLQVSGD